MSASAFHPQVELSQNEISLVKNYLASYQMSFDQTSLGESIVKISQAYQASENKTPWGLKNAFPAYASYFHVLNLARLHAVIQHLKPFGFFNNIRTVHDVGCGLGASYTAFQSEEILQAAEWYMSDYDKGALRELSKITPPGKYFLTPPERSVELEIYSYSASEMMGSFSQKKQWPLKILIVDSADSIKTRKLMALRSELIEKGYKAVSPCPHQNACPLLTLSKTDYCHFRAIFKAFPEFLKLKIPIQNRTLTYSFFAFEKTEVAALQREEFQVIGDPLTEKGRTKQAVCVSAERRNFLVYPHRGLNKKEIESLGLVRGMRYQFEQFNLTSEMFLKSDEIKVSLTPKAV